MITLTVVSYNNMAPEAPCSATFGSSGGTLGRSEENSLVLADPAGHVSRVQAMVKSDGQRHVITNLSRVTPLLVNSRTIDTDEEHALNPGDEVQIGLFRLRADMPVATAEQPSALSMPTTASAPKTDDAAMPDQRQLIQAFLQGAGIPGVALPQGLTPEFMELLGKLLATSVQGTMDLSAMRALVKREAHADVTMVVVRNNNPLKFLPDGATVLTQMFRKKMPGFMGPVEAMTDIYQDLRAHQHGMVAGVRAALGDVLKRLDPDSLEREAQAQPLSFLERLLPSLRKAKLWDEYARLHRATTARTQNDTEMLFGSAFRKAYEQQAEQARQSDANA
jgi:FHA domain-containing protein